MTKTMHFAGDCITALLLAAALALSGILLAGRVVGGVTESALYRQSKIIGSIFSKQQGVGVTNFLTDARARDVLLKFAGAVANAYVSFELIPYSEAETFTAVYESLGSAVEIEAFTYQRRDLIIAGTSPNETGYREFLRRLRQKSRFSGVTGHYYTTVDDEIRFEIECVATE